MTSTKESSKKYWLYTLISLVAIILLLAVLPEFFWVALPFLLTFGVKAYGAM